MHRKYDYESLDLPDSTKIELRIRLSPRNLRKLLFISEMLDSSPGKVIDEVLSSSLDSFLVDVYSLDEGSPLAR